MTDVKAPTRRRSKGCDQCRRRRVKCDESPGSCKQCLRFGFQCTGLTECFLVVDMTSTVSRSSLSKKPKEAQNKRGFAAGVTDRAKSKSQSQSQSQPRAQALIGEAPVDSVLPNDSNPSTTLTLGVRPYVQFENLSLSQLLPPIHQPQLVDRCEHASIYQLLGKVTCNPSSGNGLLANQWLLSTEEELSCSKLKSFKPSVRAATIAWHAFRCGDASAQADSFHWYMLCLRNHQAFLSRSASQTTRTAKKKNSIPGIGEIVVPFFLAHFEIVTCTSLTGCFQHLTAAGKVLRLRGSVNCQTGIAHQFFCALRITEATFCIVAAKPSGFASEDWRTTPFMKNAKQILHHLVDIVLVIPNYLDASYEAPDTLQTAFDDLSTKPKGVRKLIQENCLYLLRRLDTWWRDFESSDCLREDGDLAKMGGGLQHSPSTYLHRDSLTSFTVSVYNAACLILHTAIHTILLSSLPASSPILIQEALSCAVSQANSILLIASFPQEKSTSNFRSLRSPFAMKVVEMLGPNAEFKEQATKVLRRWAGTGLSGMMNVVEKEKKK